MKADAEAVSAGLDYIAGNPGIRDVIISGGDPLLLEDEVLDHLLGRLRAIPHVDIIRLGSRIPVTLPERITPRLCSILRRVHPLYLNTHFNHPREITPEAAEACTLLAEAGLPLGNQTVLLRGVNDDLQTMTQLLRGLLKIRVRPYYLHHMDLVQGAGHFRTTVESGLDIVRHLRGPVSGLAVPHYVIDLPGGKGKVPLLPDAIEQLGETVILRSPAGERVEFPNTIRHG
jgi:lysine 2,3-aminomutase